MLISGCRIVSPSTDSWVGQIPQLFTKYGLNIKVHCNTEVPFPSEGLHSFEVYLVKPETRKEWWRTASDMYKVFPITMVDFTKIPLMGSDGYRAMRLVPNPSDPSHDPTIPMNSVDILRRWATDAVNEPTVISNSASTAEYQSLQRLCCIRTYQYYSSKLQANIIKWQDELEYLDSLIETRSPELATDKVTISPQVTSFLGIENPPTLQELYTAWIESTESELAYSYNRINELISEISNNFEFTLGQRDFLRYLSHPATISSRTLYRIDLPSTDRYRPSADLMLYVRGISDSNPNTNTRSFRYQSLTTIHNQIYNPDWNLYSGDGYGWSPYQHFAHPSSSIEMQRIVGMPSGGTLSVIPISELDEGYRIMKGVTPSFPYDTLGTNFIDPAASSRNRPNLATYEESFVLVSQVLGNDLYHVTYNPTPMLEHPNYDKKQTKQIISPEPYGFGWMSYMQTVTNYGNIVTLQSDYESSIFRLNPNNPNDLYLVRSVQSINESGVEADIRWFASDLSMLVDNRGVNLIREHQDRIENPKDNDDIQTTDNIITMLLDGWEGELREGEPGDYTFTPTTFYERKIVLTFLETTFEVESYNANYSTIPIRPDAVSSFEWVFSSHVRFNISKI